MREYPTRKGPGTLHGITRQERDEQKIKVLRDALANIKAGSGDSWVAARVDRALTETE